MRRKIGRMSLGDEFLSLISNKPREDKQMETKSRYEVIADLEQKKRDLIRERDGFQDRIESKEREIKNTKRELEDLQEDLKKFKDNVKEKKETAKELIKGIEQSLERFNKLQSNK